MHRGRMKRVTDSWNASDLSNAGAGSDAADVRDVLYSDSTFESSFEILKKHNGLPRLSLRPDQCGYSGADQLVPFYELMPFNLPRFEPVQNLPQQFLRTAATVLSPHAFYTLPDISEMLSPRRICRHEETSCKLYQTFGSMPAHPATYISVASSLTPSSASLLRREVGLWRSSAS